MLGMLAASRDTLVHLNVHIAPKHGTIVTRSWGRRMVRHVARLVRLEHIVCKLSRGNHFPRGWVGNLCRHIVPLPLRIIDINGVDEAFTGLFRLLERRQEARLEMLRLECAPVVNAKGFLHLLHGLPQHTTRMEVYLVNNIGRQAQWNPALVERMLNEMEAYPNVRMAYIL